MTPEPWGNGEPLRLLTFEHDGREVPGLLRGDNSIVDLRKWGYESLLALIQAGPEAVASVGRELDTTDTELKVSDVRLLAPIPRPPRNLFCVGANYMQHIDEGVRSVGQEPPVFPIFFTKPFTTLRGSGSVVEFSRSVTSQLDWEAEVAVVIGRPGVNLSPEEAIHHVFGLMLANDLSARDLQKRSGAWSQWFKGKSLDGSCPMGPFISTIDHYGNHIPDVSFRLLVNGVEKQRANMSDMIHDISSIISDLSLGMELLPGDVILTGTPAGVGLWDSPPHFLEDGDQIVIESNVLGDLTTTIRVAD